MRRTRQQAKNERAAETDASTPSLGLSDDLSKDQATVASTANAIATESAETSAAGQKRASQDGTLKQANVSKKRSKWDPSRVLTDPNSPLTKVNLRVRTRPWLGKLLANHFSACSQARRHGMPSQLSRKTKSLVSFQMNNIYCQRSTASHPS